jgi:NADH-quinone oxidoreductase subunit A
MPELLAYILLFTGISAFFIFSHLLMGRFVRPVRPDAEKKTIYECGEPTIGSAWIQFDLRFYVVALLFVIFDVEMAFFFPWAVVFGTANRLADPNLPGEERIAIVEKMTTDDQWKLKQVPGQAAPAGTDPLRPRTEFEQSARVPLRSEAQRAAELGEISRRATPAEENREAARDFAWIAFADIVVFFGVLLVGFAYLWKRGDLDWVRSVAAQEVDDREQRTEDRGPPEPALTTAV